MLAVPASELCLLSRFRLLGFALSDPAVQLSEDFALLIDIRLSLDPRFVLLASALRLGVGLVARARFLGRIAMGIAPACAMMLSNVDAPIIF